MNLGILGDQQNYVVKNNNGFTADVNYTMKELVTCQIIHFCIAVDIQWCRDELKYNISNNVLHDQIYDCYYVQRMQMNQNNIINAICLNSYFNLKLYMNDSH